ncbi:hypothetical protein D3C85_223690 [compost metagenome]
MRWVEVHGLTIAAAMTALASLILLGMVLYKYSRFNPDNDEYWERAIKKMIIRIDKLAQKKNFRLRPADAALIIWIGAHSSIHNFRREELETHFIQLKDVLHLIEKH